MDVTEMREMIERHLPGEHDQDSHGGDGPSAVSKALDKLGLTGRIELGEGEELVGSDRLDPGNDLGDSFGDVLFATVSTPRGREYRIAIAPFDGADEWAADDDGDTATLNLRGVNRLRNDLTEVDKQAKTAAKTADKAWVAGGPPGDLVLLGTEPVAEGQVKGEWADVHWDTYLTDDDPTQWTTNLSIQRKDGSSEEFSSQLSPKDLRKLIRKLNEIAEAGALARHLLGQHDQSTHGRSGPMPWPEYEAQYEVEDEASVAGITAVAMTNGDTQVAYDSDDDHRLVLADMDVDDLRNLADAIESVVDGGEDVNLGDDLFVGRDGTDIRLGFDTDEYVISADDAAELAGAMRDIADTADAEDSVDVGRAYSPENGSAASSAPKGGQFAPGGGRVGAGSKKPTPKRPARKKGPAKPAGPMSFDGKTGTGYGIRGGDARVRTLQQALNRLGIQDASGQKLAPDGKLGPKTSAAVKKLQKTLGVAADGKVTPELLKQITEMKALPTKVRKTRVKRSRDEILDLIRGALMNRGIQRSTGSFDRAFPLDDIQISRSGDGRTVEAYAAMFGAPYEVRDQHGHYMEIIERAAFDRTLKSGAGAKAMCLYNHGMTIHGTPDALSSVPLGTPLEIKADGRGLLTVTRYNRSALADSVLEAIHNGDIKSQSFRGRIVRSSPNRVGGRRPNGSLPTITRHELGLTDYGPTPIAVNEGAAILAVRSVDMLLTDIAGLDDDGRLEILRNLGVDLDADDIEELPAPVEGDDTTTSAESELGTEDSPAGHSGRLELQRAALRAELILKGVRRAEAA